jgi:hypothetical protein
MFVTWPPLGAWECLGPSDDYESRVVNGIPSRESLAVVAKFGDSRFRQSSEGCKVVSSVCGYVDSVII